MIPHVSRSRLGPLLFLVCSPFAARSAPSGPPAEIVEPGHYAETALREIDGARRSVLVGMYLFRLPLERSDSPVFRLAEALVRAHRRGAAVEVVLDRGYGGPADLPEAGPEGKNAAAYFYLRERGVPVFFDDLAVVTHAKVLVVDEETVLLGSTNWTAAAFTKNREADLRVRSTELARRLAARLRAVPRETPPAEEIGLRLPEAFLLQEDLFGRMITQRDARSLQTALHLFRKAGGRPDPFPVDHADLAAALGLDGMGRTAYRRQINKVLRKLEKRYGLVRVSLRHGDPAEVAMVFASSGGTVAVPDAFWSRGWSHRLSLAAACAYLIGRRESAVSAFPPRWSASVPTLAARYHASAWFVSQGFTELHRYNLVEVDRAPLGPHGSDRPNIYAPAPLYDFGEAERALAALSAEHGAEKAARARRAASLVYEDWDVAGIRQLILLEDRYGVPTVDAALAKLGEKLPVNPKRSLPYLIGTIHRMGQSDGAE